MIQIMYLMFRTESIFYRVQRHHAVMDTTAGASNSDAICNRWSNMINFIQRINISDDKGRTCISPCFPASSVSNQQQRSHAWFHSSCPGPAMWLFHATIAGCKHFRWVSALWGTSRTWPHSSQSFRSQCRHRESQTSPTSSMRLFECAGGSDGDNDFSARPSLYIRAQLVLEVLYHISTRSN